jgi:hypothetical protein
MVAGDVGAIPALNDTAPILLFGEPREDEGVP